jgi:hypothetical protein
MLDWARDLQARAVLAVALEEGDRTPSTDAAAEAFGLALGLEPGLFAVSTINPSCFLIELPTPECRAVALGWDGVLNIENVRHHLMLWSLDTGVTGGIGHPLLQGAHLLERCSTACPTALHGGQAAALEDADGEGRPGPSGAAGGGLLLLLGVDT